MPFPHCHRNSYRSTINLIALILLLTVSVSISAAPSQAAGECKEYYKEFAAQSDFKVMVKGKKKGQWWCWWNGGFSSLEEAKKSLLGDCKREARSCVVEYATNEKKYWSKIDKKELCQKALEPVPTAWETRPAFAKHVTEAKRRGLTVDDCRLALSTGNLHNKLSDSSNSAFLRGLSELPNSSLCASALVANRESFATGSALAAEVAEVKRRGLSIDECRAALGLRNTTVAGITTLSSIAPNHLCYLALSPDRTNWSSTGNINQVSEAKRRGLTVDDCRVEIGLKGLATGVVNTTSEPTPSDTSQKSDWVICVSALVANREGFATGDAYLAEVAEAQRRGLTVDNCRVAIGLAPLKGGNVQPNVISQQALPKPQALSLNEICEQSLNADKTDWSAVASATEARRQAEALGITIDVCRVKLGITQEQQIAQADDVTPPTVQPDAIAGRRVALVVGINEYENLPKLQKAVNDSRAVSQTLTSIGYDVVSVENPDRRTLNRKLSELQAKIQPGDNALFYFAGHGVALGGENILIAADIPKPASGDEDLVRSEGFSVDDIVRRIQKQGAKTAFLVLDACRDNPFEATGTRSIGTTRGLSKTDTPSGVFVLFSAGIGQAALDRLSDVDSDPNSVFTRKLLPALQSPSVTHIDLAKKVQKEVAELASTINHQQQPAYYDQIIGEVVINPK